ncbi:hypothetical protein HMPREF1980_00545 [Actinomyces sp. oral taxon 172 str. F0311]|nr:hypothetical protein HMPREF1980_00545 [Actinomyces sp. oral taxon 172 str. F0311]
MIDLEARPGPAGPAQASTHHTPAHPPTPTVTRMVPHKCRMQFPNTLFKL